MYIESIDSLREFLYEQMNYYKSVDNIELAHSVATIIDYLNENSGVLVEEVLQMMEEI